MTRVRVLSRIAATTAVSLGMLRAAPARAQAAEPPPFPPPGRMVDVGGWRLHLNCTGDTASTRPTVILEAGAGDFSVEWSLVQPKVAAFARVCSYDRSDDGWSDYGPRPRTMHQIVYELHALLANAGIRPPYVLVGHSFGGVLVRLYAYTYPRDVGGIVLIESGVDDPVRNLNGTLVRPARTDSGGSVPAVKTSGPLREADIPAAALAQIRAAAQSLAPTANEAPRNLLPPEAQHMRTWALSQIKHYAANDNAFDGAELAGMIAHRQVFPVPLGDIRLVVLTSGAPSDLPPRVEADRQAQQAGLANLSRNGRQVITTKSGHHIQLQEPDLVVRAIRAVLMGEDPTSGHTS
jgi:pimeloyl-ACP methyl ester carboxylesterase